jgi:hypothetical protein
MRHQSKKKELRKLKKLKDFWINVNFKQNMHILIIFCIVSEVRNKDDKILLFRGKKCTSLKLFTPP